LSGIDLRCRVYGSCIRRKKICTLSTVFLIYGSSTWYPESFLGRAWKNKQLGYIG
jgi:hypothetical protein